MADAHFKCQLMCSSYSNNHGEIQLDVTFTRDGMNNNRFHITDIVNYLRKQLHVFYSSLLGNFRKIIHLKRLAKFVRLDVVDERVDAS